MAYNPNARGNLKVNGIQLDSAIDPAGSGAIGDDNSYSNFTPTEPTTKGALQGIDSALAGANATAFADNVFRVQDNSDPTKQLAFEVSAINASTTRIWSVPDINIDFATTVGGTYANATLSNLGTTSLNTDLLPSGSLARSVGSALLPMLAVWAQSFTRDGNLSLFSQDVATGSSGTVSVFTGTTSAGSGDTGSLLFNTGNIAVNISADTGMVSIKSGNTSSTNAASQSGSVTLASGSANAGPSGNLTLETGVSTLGDSGDVFLRSGNSATNSGTLNLVSGNSSAANSGDVILQTGTAAVTRGKIKLQDGSEGTVGYVWTQTDVDGSGEWQPAAAAGANTALSNLLTTAINADLLPNITDTRTLGSVANYWLSGHINSIVSKNIAITKADDSNDYFYLTDSAPNWWTTVSPGILFQSGIGENDYAIVTSDGSGSARSADIAVVTGANGSASGFGTGDLFIVSGAITNASSTAQTGGVVLYTGDNAGTNKSGDIEIYSGAAVGNTGRIAIETSDSVAGDSGPIQFRTGSAPGGIRGKLRFMDGSEGTAGYIWTSVDTLGHGTWMPAPATGANTSLSNLVSPTLVNQDLDPDSDFGRSLGQLNKWNELFAYQSNLAGVGLYDWDDTQLDIVRFFLNDSFNSETTPNATLKVMRATGAYTSGPALAIGTDNNFGGEILIASANRNINLNSGDIRFKIGAVSGSGVSGNFIFDGGGQSNGAILGLSDNSLRVGRPDIKMAEIYSWGMNSFNFTSWDYDAGPSGAMIANFAPNESINGSDGDQGLIVHNSPDGSSNPYGLVIGTAAATAKNILLASANQTGANPTGFIEIGTGSAVSGTTGDAYFYTGNSTNGNSGNVSIGSGNAGASGTAGYVQITSGAGDVSGFIELNVGNANTTSGDIKFTGARKVYFDNRLFYQKDYTDSYWATPQVALVIDSDVPNDNGNLFIGSTDVTTGTSHSVTLFSGAASAGAHSGLMQFASGSVTGSGNSGILEIFSGDVEDGQSGPVHIFAGIATGTGTRGNIGLSANRVAIFNASNQHSIFFQYNFNDVNYWGDEVAAIVAPSDVPNNSSAFAIATGDLNVDSSTHDMSLTTGANEFNTTAGKRTGDLYLQTGVILDGAGTSGAIFLVSGYNDDSGSTGLVRLSSGEGNGTGNTGSITTESGPAGGNSGEVFLRSGNAGGNSGNVNIYTGSAVGTRGSIELTASAINVNSTPIKEVPTATPANTDYAVNVEYINNRAGHWKRYRVNASYFSTAAASSTKNLFVLGASESIDEVIVKHELAFNGGTAASAVIEVGKTGNNNAYKTAQEVFSAPAGTGFGRARVDQLESFDATTQVTVTLTITGDTIDNLVQGAVDIYVKIVKIHPSTINAEATLS